MSWKGYKFRFKFKFKLKLRRIRKRVVYRRDAEAAEGRPDEDEDWGNSESGKLGRGEQLACSTDERP